MSGQQHYYGTSVHQNVQIIIDYLRISVFQVDGEPLVDSKRIILLM